MTHAGEAQLEAELDGQVHEVAVLPGQVLIEALEAAGIDAPHSCRAGLCAACMCKLVEGQVELLENHVLDQNDLDEGWILGCQAVARSPRVRIRYTS